MARIRTIKPEFFTSEDIVGLSPLARLLYIATWCEADKEGRMLWKPKTFKMRYFPGDECDINALCDELVSAGLIVLYDDNLAYIPRFKSHQHINPREAVSVLKSPPEDDASSRVIDASARVNAPSVTRMEEGKGREHIYTRGDDAPPEPIPEPSAPEGFDAFWAEWPSGGRKGGKAECLKVWRKEKLEGQALAIIGHVKAMRSSREWTKDGGEYIPAPVVYLRGKRWDGAMDPGGVSSQPGIHPIFGRIV